MAACIADRAVHTLEAPTLVQKNTINGLCVFSRLSKWLWSGWSAAGRSKPHDGVLGRPQPSGPSRATSPQPTNTISRQIASEDAEIRSNAQEQPIENALPCRACKAWGVQCDLQKPRCSHCLDQQILCFYVAPLRLTMKRSKKLPTARTETVTS